MISTNSLQAVSVTFLELQCSSFPRRLPLIEKLFDVGSIKKSVRSFQKDPRLHLELKKLEDIIGRTHDQKELIGNGTTELMNMFA